MTDCVMITFRTGLYEKARELRYTRFRSLPGTAVCSWRTWRTTTHVSNDFLSTAPLNLLAYSIRKGMLISSRTRAITRNPEMIGSRCCSDSARDSRSSSFSSKTVIIIRNRKKKTSSKPDLTPEHKGAGEKKTQKPKQRPDLIRTPRLRTGTRTGTYNQNQRQNQVQKQKTRSRTKTRTLEQNPVQ